VEDRYEPATIDVKRDEGVSITFLDGHVAWFDLVTLRRGCPCATCRGLRDRGEDAWPRPGSPTPLRVESAKLHGGWGLTIRWNDGHGTGIFPFESLRDWSIGGAQFRPDSGLSGTGD
jgi:prepilin-type processing-associated H-X9-DG protein